jgi:hypothetical protein
MAKCRLIYYVPAIESTSDANQIVAEAWLISRQAIPLARFRTQTRKSSANLHLSMPRSENTIQKPATKHADIARANR